jgi:hypothetical protein
VAKFLSDLVFLDFQAKTSHKPSGKQSAATDADELDHGTAGELERLQRLHANGDLSDEEFATIRASLL